jgi:hypothetical protein
MSNGSNGSHRNLGSARAWRADLRALAQIIFLLHPPEGLLGEGAEKSTRWRVRSLEEIRAREFRG